jgi:hypothetical protein
VPQVMEVERPTDAGGLDCSRPSHRAPKVARPQNLALPAGEDQRLRVLFEVGRQMRTQRVEGGYRQRHGMYDKWPRK